MDAELGVAGGGQHSHRGRADASAGRQQVVALAHIAAGPSDVPAGLDRGSDRHGLRQRGHALRGIGVLDLDHGVSARRHHPAGQHAHRLALADAALGLVPGRDLAHDRERHRRLG